MERVDWKIISRDTLTLQEVYEALHAKEKMKEYCEEQVKRATNQKPTRQQDDDGKAAYAAENNSKEMFFTLDLKGTSIFAEVKRGFLKVIPNVTIQNSSSDTTEPLHNMRLGIRVNYGLIDLSKRGLLDGHARYSGLCTFLNYGDPSQEYIKLGGARYIVDNLDDFSKRSGHNFLKHKSEALLSIQRMESHGGNPDWRLEEIFICEQPEGFIVPGKENLYVDKEITYGLKHPQAMASCQNQDDEINYMEKYRMLVRWKRALESSSWIFRYLLVLLMLVLKLEVLVKIMLAMVDSDYSRRFGQ
ncbi:hypothetical protein Tco_0382513 [Tanacetum coccineum]